MTLARSGLGLLAIAGAAWLQLSAAAAADLVAVTDRGEVVHFSDADPGRVVRRGIHGTGGALVGIDVRPADGQLYGLTSEGAILVIDPVTGLSVFKAMLSVPLARAPGYLVDFNPVADRLRVVGAGGQNLRVDVDTGAAVVDGTIRHAAGGGEPRVVAGAYSNSIRGATATQLYVFDAASGAYALQNPPNDGVLQPLGAAGGIAADGADIWSDGTGNQGYAVAGNVLHVFDVASGASRPIGAIGGGVVGRIVDIAVLPPRR